MKLALKIFVAAARTRALRLVRPARGRWGNRARLRESRAGWRPWFCCRSAWFICSIPSAGVLLSANEGVPGVGFGTLVRIRWAGESINTVLPSAYIGGEAAKVQLLHKRGVPRMHSASSVVAGKTAQVLAQVMFIAAGAVAGAANLPPAITGARRNARHHRAGRLPSWRCFSGFSNAECFARSPPSCRCVL